MSSSRHVIVMYMPVIHRGYIDFLEAHPEVKNVYILDFEIAHELRSIKKDHRALDPRMVVNLLEGAIGIEPDFWVTWSQNLHSLNRENVVVYMPDEDISRYVAAEYLPDCVVQFENIHLRWNEQNLHQMTEVVSSVPTAVLGFLAKALALSENSPDWWRQVGAVCFRGSEELESAYNRHLPTDYEVLFVGDPRSSSKQGQDIELSLALHAEAGIISQAAKRGIALGGASLVTTTFPCPVCARLIATAGISEVYYLEPYSMLDAQYILESAGVKLIPLTEKPLPA